MRAGRAMHIPQKKEQKRLKTEQKLSSLMDSKPYRGNKDTYKSLICQPNH